MTRRVIAIAAAFGGASCQTGTVPEGAESPADRTSGRPSLSPEDADRSIVARHIGEEFAAALNADDCRRAAKAIVAAIRWQNEKAGEP